MRMQGGMIPTTGLSGLLLEADPSRVLAMRKYALTMGTLLQGYANQREIVSNLKKGETGFILLDYPESSAAVLDFITSIARNHSSVPVLAILPEGAGEALKEEVIKAGVWDFFVRPVGIKEYQMRMRNVLRIRRVSGAFAEETVGRESEIRDAIGQILLREYETLYVLGKAAEYKDEDTGSHILRVANYAKLIAEMLGEDENGQDVIYHASALHDIGKIGIPDSILLKPARLDDREVTVMRTHTTNGHGILEHSASSYLLTGAMIALTHHERYDGGGYPIGLSGEEIPTYGRIVCIADVFDALTTKRPYKEPWPLDRAFALLTDERGRQFDPALVDAFVCNLPRVEQIYHENTNA
jgi:response regulator RpfG family c-di-GMP phosphodiesterase